MDSLDKKQTPNKTFFLIEPFYGGSHKQLIDVLHKHLKGSSLITLSAKKWPWRARCSSLILSLKVPSCTTEQILFCSSVVSLAELIGLRPDLQKLKKIVYFHENQFIYPVRDIKKRDIQFGYNQITTCLVADVLIFNSEFNKNSLLDNLNRIIKILPDYRPKNLRLQIEPKCKVLYFPIYFPPFKVEKKRLDILHIVWPHRWEFDKDPEGFLSVMVRLKLASCKFQLSLVGETFTDVPEVFERTKPILQDCLLQYGYLEDKEEYYNVLKTAHVAVSTAVHEFFGVSMLEATYFGCYPLVPKRLVYPELYPSECCYNDLDELFDILLFYCQNTPAVIACKETLKLDINKYSIESLLPLYLREFE